jgi:multidrug resistance efflux pump
MTTYTPHTNKRYRMATFHDVISATEAIGRINIDLAHCEACLRETEKELYQRNAQLEKAEAEIERLKAEYDRKWSHELAKSHGA